MTIGEALLAARRKAGLTQDDVAAALSVSKAFISMVENGDRPFPPDRIAGLPTAIRGTVIDAAIDELCDRIQKLSKMR